MSLNYKNIRLFLLFFLLTQTRLWAQFNQTITWTQTATNNYKSNYLACRANDGYLECNTVPGYRIGMTTAATPNGSNSMAYAVLFNTIGSPHKIEFYEKGVLKLSYNVSGSLLASHKIRLERSGSVLTVQYQNTTGGPFNPIYSYTSDPNFFYRFHVITTGGAPTGLNAAIQVGYGDPCSGVNTPGADATINWTQAKVFDGDMQEIIQVGETRTFTNRFGAEIQSQTKNFSNNVVMGEETRLIDIHQKLK